MKCVLLMLKTKKKKIINKIESLMRYPSDSYPFVAFWVSVLSQHDSFEDILQQCLRLATVTTSWATTLSTSTGIALLVYPFCIPMSVLNYVIFDLTLYFRWQHVLQRLGRSERIQDAGILTICSLLNTKFGSLSILLQFLLREGVVSPLPVVKAVTADPYECLR